MKGLAFATLLDRYDCAMDPIGKYEPCAHGGYKIALVCAPSITTTCSGRTGRGYGPISSWAPA